MCVHYKFEAKILTRVGSKNKQKKRETKFAIILKTKAVYHYTKVFMFIYKKNRISSSSLITFSLRPIKFITNKARLHIPEFDQINKS